MKFLDNPDTSETKPKNQDVPKFVLLLILLIVSVILVFVSKCIADANKLVYGTAGETSGEVTKESPPVLEATETLDISGMFITFENYGKFIPNDNMTDIWESAQLFQASKYYMYLNTPDGREIHTPLTQCKLLVNENDVNKVRVDWYVGIDHPYVYLNMDGEEFYQNVGAEFFDNFTVGMQEFVYQYLLETLPMDKEDLNPSANTEPANEHID